MYNQRCLEQLVLRLPQSHIHHVHAQVHLLSALKAVKIKATHHFLQRKSSEHKLPIKPTSMYQMEVDGFVLGFFSRSVHLGLHLLQTNVCHSTFSWWVWCDLSFLLSSSPSISFSLRTPFITRPSEKVAWQWCDGATLPVKMDCYPGRFAKTHTHVCACLAAHKHRGRIISIHTIAHTHDHTITDPAACSDAHMLQWAAGPVRRRSLNLTQCSSWKQAQGGIMASLSMLQHETRVLTWDISFVPLTSLFALNT